MLLVVLIQMTSVKSAKLFGPVRPQPAAYTATQHLSPNHVIKFPDGDPDRAICTSYIYAQHHLDKLDNNEFRLLRGAWSNHIVGTAGGGRIARLIQHISWHEAREQ